MNGSKALKYRRKVIIPGSENPMRLTVPDRKNRLNFGVICCNPTMGRRLAICDDAKMPGASQQHVCRHALYTAHPACGIRCTRLRPYNHLPSCAVDMGFHAVGRAFLAQRRHIA